MRKLMMLAFSALFLLSLNAANPKSTTPLLFHWTVFRWDYPAMYRTQFRPYGDGVKAVMLPPILLLHFNHYTTLAGLVPGHRA